MIYFFNISHTHLPNTISLLIFLPQGHCSQFSPTEHGGSLGWKKVGYCSGSQAPTASPTDYSGTCTYEKCVGGTASPSTSPSSSPSKGPTGSPSASPSKAPSRAPSASPESAPLSRRKLQAETIPRLSRNLEVCTTEDVLNYSSSTDYEEGDVVRIGTKRFKCRGWPNGLWCKESAYAPSLKPGIWSDAWVEDGNCLYEPPPPSQSPSKNPTKTPSVSPTSNVSIFVKSYDIHISVHILKKDTESIFSSHHLHIPFSSQPLLSQPTSSPTTSPTNAPSSSPTSNVSINICV